MLCIDWWPDMFFGGKRYLWSNFLFVICILVLYPRSILGIEGNNWKSKKRKNYLEVIYLISYKSIITAAPSNNWIRNWSKGCVHHPSYWRGWGRWIISSKNVWPMNLVWVNPGQLDETLSQDAKYSQSRADSSHTALNQPALGAGFVPQHPKREERKKMDKEFEQIFF